LAALNTALTRVVDDAGMTTTPRQATRVAASHGSRLPQAGRIVARAAPAAILVLASPLVIDVLTGQPGAAAELHRRSADVLGKGALLTLLGSYAVTPLATLTGWRWHLPLRRDFALWTCAFAFTDLLIAAMPGPHGPSHGPSHGIAGNAGLAAGTMATLLLVPLAVTSNRLSMRLLGPGWKRFHTLIYPVFGLVALHLWFVGSPLFAGTFAALTVLLWIPRAGPVRRRLRRRRRRPRDPADSREGADRHARR
jgi:methionine sulfoxide reductase heme-binding subunit